ncbi:L-threonylcarbamoyladenylate synthase [Novosphingobium pentaromativorans]|uniref:Threonylcarbamoyl-AMP synthase n=1 Tax=Novosphingobium pentaromativorans US6-1 TaxID=1088721 RepID=G6EBI9_9SPHN|nr:L-threonylcarbamoyladenylate synthase [Novosphingobium pentaromativorans]AIT80365.1 translation factor Sua5 [Novosphingobium pentaromativorans US6-1]EHJ61271.1 translation factor SUA5 [Novosphingobium pentaromativorans US6-1]
MAQSSEQSPAGRPALLPSDPEGIAEAARVLREGGLVAVPTETVYGLAARADRDEAVASIYRAKGRPSFNPLIVHIADTASAMQLAVFDERALLLAERFWPGALTLVLPVQENAPIAAAVTAGLPTVALRCPAHPVMRRVIAEAGLPLAAPSANRSGGVSPTTPMHVVDSLGDRIAAVLDGGACEAGLESTIIALREGGRWQILRPGPIPESEIAAVLGSGSDAVTSQAIEAPGQLASHYAPGKPVRLAVRSADSDEFHIGFAEVAGQVTLSASGDLAEAASRLYALLHQGAASQLPRIAVAPIPEVGIGKAINDRLRRAAA